MEPSMDECGWLKDWGTHGGMTAGVRWSELFPLESAESRKGEWEVRVMRACVRTHLLHDLVPVLLLMSVWQSEREWGTAGAQNPFILCVAQTRVTFFNQWEEQMRDNCPACCISSPKCSLKQPHANMNPAAWHSLCTVILYFLRKRWASMAASRGLTGWASWPRRLTGGTLPNCLLVRKLLASWIVFFSSASSSCWRM